MLNLPVLLVQPSSGAYEILSVTVPLHPGNFAAANEVLTQEIRRVAQQEKFRQLSYDGICNAQGILMSHNFFREHMASSNEQQNVLQVAIPHKVSVESCCRLARRILRQAKMIALVSILQCLRNRIPQVSHSVFSSLLK